MIALAMLLGAREALAQPVQPLRAQVGRCVPTRLPDDISGGRGNTPETRKVRIEFAYAVRQAADNADDRRQAAVDLTTKIVICSARYRYDTHQGQIDCTPDLYHVIYWKDHMGSKPKVATVKKFGDVGANEYKDDIPLDWGDQANAGTFLFLRVNDEEYRDAVQLGGFCPVAWPLVGHDIPGSPLIVYGVTRGGAANPFPYLSDYCTDGAGNKTGYFSKSPCMDPAAPQFLYDRLREIDSWQISRVMGKEMATNVLKRPVMDDGTNPACNGVCPYQLVSIPNEMYSHGGMAEMEIGPTPAYPPGVVVPKHISREAGGDIRLLAHEYFHGLELAWKRTYPSSEIKFNTLPFADGASPAIEDNLCIKPYPGVPPDQCVSPRKLGSGGTGTGFGWFNFFLQQPQLNALNHYYAADIFWRYAMEQFATPISNDPQTPNPAHPSGKDSQFRVPLPPVPPLGDTSRDSDEGVDLLGMMMKGFSESPDKHTLDAIDDVLRAKLGRGFRPVIFDMHTAALLKDYPEVDPRWKFEWVGDYNAGEAQSLLCKYAKDTKTGACADPVKPADALAGRKPFPVSAEYRPDPLTRPDMLSRASRVLDSCVGCSGCTYAAPQVLNAGETAASPLDVQLEPFGAAYLSVRPVVGYGALNVHVESSGGAEPWVRIFLVKPGKGTRPCVDSAGDPFLAVGCNTNPTGDLLADTQRCPAKELPGGGVEVDQYVDPDSAEVGGHADEVLVVVSAGRGGAKFGWRFGPAQPYVNIMDPTTAHPIDIGYPATGTVRPFPLKFYVRDEKGKLVGGLRPPTVSINVPGCTAQANDADYSVCRLKYGTDYDFYEFGRGLYWAIVQVPAQLYPSVLTRDTLDLRVEVTSGFTSPASDLQENALVLNTAPRHQATVLVLDRSDSMNWYGGVKLQALRDAAKLVIAGMLDTDDLGIVTFNHDAQSAEPYFFPLNDQGRHDADIILSGIAAGGMTSIGDGVLEAQSNLIKQYGDRPQGVPPILNMIVLSDGIQNSEWHPKTYYYPGQRPEYYSDGLKKWNGSELVDDTPDDDNQPWVSDTTLNHPDRRWGRLLVPTVSAIGIGQDASPMELNALATEGGGTYVEIDGPVSGDQLLSTTLDLGDAFRQAANAGSGHQRVQAARSTVLAGLVPSDLPGMTVEPRTYELLVSVLSPVYGPSSLCLVSPSGQHVEPVKVGMAVAVFRVPSPEAGYWSWCSNGPPAFAMWPWGVPPTEPGVLVEQAVRHPVVLYADISGQMPANPLESDLWEGMLLPMPVGRTVHIRAIPTEDGPIVGATVYAKIRTPRGRQVVVNLTDNGAPVEGQANDGLYGAVYMPATNTVECVAFPCAALTGAYNVELIADGISPRTGMPFHREKSMTFVVGDMPDSDGDGMPDWWEPMAGTQLNTPDGMNDPDADGLVNQDEFRWGTSPIDSDTDGGGESDGSERAAGRNPLDPRDDVARVYFPHVVPGNGKVLVSVPVPPAPGVAVELQSSPARQGPFNNVWSGAAPASTVFAAAAPNDQETCYRLRVSTQAATGGWSAPTCVVPRRDPFPPVVQIEAKGNATWTHTRAVTVRLVAGDPSRSPGSDQRLCDPDVVSTGVKEMMISTHAGFEGASWRPYATEISVWLDDASQGSVWVKVRDGAGNESRPVGMLLNLVSNGPVGAAMRLEERALDRLGEGKWVEVRSTINQSIPEIDRAIQAVTKALVPPIGQPYDPHVGDLLGQLIRVKTYKAQASAFATPFMAQYAKNALGQALQIERQIADDPIFVRATP